MVKSYYAKNTTEHQAVSTRMRNQKTLKVSVQLLSDLSLDIAHTL